MNLHPCPLEGIQILSQGTWRLALPEQERWTYVKTKRHLSQSSGHS